MHVDTQGGDLYFCVKFAVLAGDFCYIRLMFCCSNKVWLLVFSPKWPWANPVNFSTNIEFLYQHCEFLYQHCEFLYQHCEFYQSCNTMQI